MGNEEIGVLLDALVEELAAIEHQRWSRWQRYLHSQCMHQPDGSLLIPCDLVKRWERQCETKYEELGDQERESDREQVRQYLPLIVAALASRPEAEHGEIEHSGS
jgi:hypothetical protein